MILHENRLPADNCHVISYLFLKEIGKDVPKFAVCCSRDWRFKGQKEDIFRTQNHDYGVLVIPSLLGRRKKGLKF